MNIAAFGCFEYRVKLGWNSPRRRLRQVAEKLFFEGVILSEAKDLLSARAESKADPKRIGATSGRY
jgi:hypothetical protein